MPATVGGIKAGRAFILIEAVDRTGKVLNAIKGKLGRTAADVSAMGSTMALRAAAALTPVALATKTYADFDDSMRRVEARSRGTAEEMVSIREQAKLLGRTTAFTASQIGELQAKLAQKGFARGDILKMTENVMSLARAGGTGDLMADITMSADLVSGTIRAFELAATDSARVADLMTATINNSNYSLEELLVSMQYAGPAAKNFNMSMEDTLAMLGAMRDLNLDASIAGTAFRNMLNYTSKQAERDKFNEKLQEMTGSIIDFTDEEGNLRNMRDILVAISKAVSELGTAERAELYDMLFETRAAVPAAAVGRSVETMSRLLSVYDKADGLSKRTERTMETGLGGTFRELESSVEGVAIAIGEALDNSLMRFGLVGQRTLELITEWIKHNEGLVTGIVLLVAGVGILGVGMILLGQAVLSLTPLFTLAATITALTSSMLLFVAPWVAAAAAIYLAGRAIADFTGKTVAYDTAIKSTTDSTTEYVSAAFGEVGEFIGEMGEAIFSHWESTIQSIALALQRGDIQMASDLLWKGLEISWTTGSNRLMDIVDNVTGKLLSAFSGGAANPFTQLDIWWYENVNIPFNKKMLELTRMAYGYGPGDKVDPQGYGGGPISTLEKSIPALEERVKIMREDLANNPVDAEINSKNKAKAEAREKQLEQIKSELEDIKMYNQFLADATPSPTDPRFNSPSMDNPAWKSTIEEAAAGLLGPEGIATGAGGTIAPDIIKGLQKGSMEAAQAFQENKFAMYGEKLGEIAKAAAETAAHTKSMDEKMAVSDASEFAV